MTFREFCRKHSVTRRERRSLAAYLMAFRFAKLIGEP
jgi:hypothetical protein